MGEEALVGEVLGEEGVSRRGVVGKEVLVGEEALVGEEVQGDIKRVLDPVSLELTCFLN